MWMWFSHSVAADAHKEKTNSLRLCYKNVCCWKKKREKKIHFQHHHLNIIQKLNKMCKMICPFPTNTPILHGMYGKKQYWGLSWAGRPHISPTYRLSWEYTLEKCSIKPQDDISPLSKCLPTLQNNGHSAPARCCVAPPVRESHQTFHFAKQQGWKTRQINGVSVRRAAGQITAAK